MVGNGGWQDRLANATLHCRSGSMLKSRACQNTAPTSNSPASQETRPRVRKAPRGQWPISHATSSALLCRCEVQGQIRVLVRHAIVMFVCSSLTRHQNVLTGFDTSLSALQLFCVFC